MQHKLFNDFPEAVPDSEDRIGELVEKAKKDPSSLTCDEIREMADMLEKVKRGENWEDFDPGDLSGGL